MIIYNPLGKNIMQGIAQTGQTPLCYALKLSVFQPMVISIVGAGGKTTLLYRLAKELSEIGKRVIVTTTTHIVRPIQYPCILIEKAQELSYHPSDRIIVAAAGESKDGKLSGLNVEEIAQLKHYADVVLVEADGAKGLPLKVPAEHEPVISEASDYVIACAGLDCLYQPLNKTCFRIKEAMSLLSTDEDHIITEKDVADILTSEKGARKAVGNKAFRIILNKADTEEKIKEAMLIHGNLLQWKELCIFTSFLGS